MMNFHSKDIMHVSKITLKVKDLKIMQKFYQEILGFSVIKEDEDEVVLGTSKRPLLTLTKLDEAHIASRDAGLYHVAYLLPTRADLASIAMHLYQLGIQFGAGDHWVSEAIYFNDPEGNGIEIYADRDHESWVWNLDEVKMVTEPVDFDDLFKEIKNKFVNLPEDTKIGHIHLQVSNIEENRKFYHTGIGFDIVSHLPHALFLSSEKYHHHVAFNTWLGQRISNPSDHTTGLSSFTINVPSKHEKTNILKKLQSLGFEVMESVAIDPSGTKVVFEAL